MDADRMAAEFVSPYLSACENALNPGQLAEVLFSATAQLGLPYVACGAHISPDQADKRFLLLNYPPEWRRLYRARGYFRLDPVLRYAERVRTGFAWDDGAFLATLTDRQRRILGQARIYRLAHGFTVPLRHDPFAPASVSVIPETGDIKPWVRRAVALLGAIVYQAGTLLLGAAAAQQATNALSPRERQCLDLKARGASDREIASTLSISVSTVCRHLEQAKIRLNARSREHAIWRAIETRQLP